MSDRSNSRIEELAESLFSYFNARFEIFRLDIISFGTNTTSALLKMLVIGGLIFITVSFLGFGLAFFLGELFNSQYLGFFIVGIFFGMFTLVLVKSWNKMIKPLILRMFINMMPDEEEDK